MRLTINGETHAVDVEDNMPLLWVLREELGMRGTKFGCGVAQCGACTVHLNGRAVRSCVTPAKVAQGAKVVTIEGLGTPEAPHPVQKAWLEQQIPQCGYCQCGMQMAVAAFIEHNPDPTDEDIEVGITNICRCGCYQRIRDAIRPLPEPVYKDRSTYRFIGRRFPRIDLPDKIFGKPGYGIDERVEGMRYAAVAPPPLAAGTITAVGNQAEVRQMKGVEAIVEREGYVAVVADNPWRAEQAVRKLSLEGAPGPMGVLESSLLRHVRLEMTKELTDGLLDGPGVVEATYQTPYYAHVPMEPMNATVWEEGGKHHVAAGVQGMLAARNEAASALGRSFDDVVLHPRSMGGGFGRRNAHVRAGCVAVGG